MTTLAKVVNSLGEPIVRICTLLYSNFGCNTKEGVPCNRKLIGARYFNNAYAAYAAEVDPSKLPVNASARDDDGHGTHTLSTAGGNFVSGANVFGLGNGTAKGDSPKARVAAYKVCWKSINGSGGCFDADILAAFEAAIHDGVDIIPASIGGYPTDYFSDGITIGLFHAVKHGITVIMSAGNEGPADGSVSNVAPWLLIVGANTIDREFPVKIGLGNRKHLKGSNVKTKKGGSIFEVLCMMFDGSLDAVCTCSKSSQTFHSLDDLPSVLKAKLLHLGK